MPARCTWCSARRPVRRWICRLDGGGDDSLNGGAGEDVIRVGATAGADVFNGWTGSGRIVAVAASAVMGMASFGAANSIETITANGLTGVQIRGTTGNDNLNFSATTLTGITRINADLSNDTVAGSGGADTIVGGGGRDTMTGGLGNDVFDFNLLSESGAGTLWDLITGFAPGTDKIDLSTMDAGILAGNAGDQAFAFINNVGFSGAAAAEVRVDTGTAGYTRILIDTDDVGTGVNMEIRVANEGMLPAPTAVDYML